MNKYEHKVYIAYSQQGFWYHDGIKECAMHGRFYCMIKGDTVYVLQPVYSGLDGYKAGKVKLEVLRKKAKCAQLARVWNCLSFEQRFAETMLQQLPF